MYIGNTEAAFIAGEVKGEAVTIGNENYYKISNVDEMRPFFMSIVSHSNHWMFIASNGGLTAGRKNSNSALFPYYTDDKITESSEITGSKTIIQIHKNEKTFLWEPFSQRYLGIYNIQRNLYKNEFGNKVIFEEINLDLEITFQYQWTSSDQFGFVKKSTLINNTATNLQLTVLDGLQNIIPYGVSSDLQNASSNLVDAYKKCELEVDAGLGIYALSAIIVDKAEPSEALKASVVWSLGHTNPTYLLSSLQLNNFRKGKSIQQEIDIKAEKGAYFTADTIQLNANTSKSWLTIAEVNQSIVNVHEIIEKIKNVPNLFSLVEDDIETGTKQLIQLNGNADGLQLTADTLRNTRHFANTLFNIMRGGIFDDNYQIEKADFVAYISKANTQVFKEKAAFLNQLPAIFNLNDIKNSAQNDTDTNFKRLIFEYMPLKFSRRHGDPSRPWNKFSINTRSEIDGSKILDYEGNWRDIFQNWEALAHSYPKFMESMIHKFLNATTFDGYNPYRVTKSGFDWETIEPDNPWSYIGYWGDHQIIYLLKFLEFIEKHEPNKLTEYFNNSVFVYANVPYKIKEYSSILKNPKDTIDFDFELDKQIHQKKEVLGADGALIFDKNNSIYTVNFIEKLLATILAKVSNFIPEAGIWLNTQRPEWNDANNALVGNGVSMVTLYYLRRFLSFFNGLVSKSEGTTVEVSEELVTFFNQVVTTLTKNSDLLNGKISDTNRKTITDALGKSGSLYRNTIYKNGFSAQKKSISTTDLQNFIQITLQFIDHSIAANKRADNLYHAYNLMTVENEQEISISYLPEMLEGQVAVLSSGFVSATEAVELLNAMKNSALFRPDQYSYILYPNKTLARFSKKNNIPEKWIQNSMLLTTLVAEQNNQIVEVDVNGQYHFNGNFNNAASLKTALAKLPEKYQELVKKDSKLVFEAFESVFNHKAFTGRSGTFFGYEGLGSIYWHMVSKLLLSVQEISLHAIQTKQNEAIIGKLLDHYYEINAGIGVHKSPTLYGAFPTDPYSHTPAGKGAQQPGMTGQVKEDVLTRFGELGVMVEAGRLSFHPSLLQKNEFLTTAQTFHYTSIHKKEQCIELAPQSLCFTYCQVPIIYKLASSNSINVLFTNGSSMEVQGLSLDLKTSTMLFDRTGEIDQIQVFLNK